MEALTKNTPEPLSKPPRPCRGSGWPPEACRHYGAALPVWITRPDLRRGPPAGEADHDHRQRRAPVDPRLLPHWERPTAYGLPLCTAAATYRSGRWVLVTSRPMRRGASRNAIARPPEFLLRRGFWRRGAGDRWKPSGP